MTTPKGIIFDLDGTLVDSLTVTFNSLNHGITKMGGKELPPLELLKFFGPGEPEIFEKILGKDKASEAFIASRSYLDAHIADVPLHEGIKDLLENLDQKKVPISIFTGRSWETTEMILKHHGILDRFVTVIASSHVTFPKPSPEGLHLALSRMKLQPEEVLFVGDSPTDMMASRAAGTQGVAALWDLMANRHLLAPYEPPFWASFPVDITHIF